MAVRPIDAVQVLKDINWHHKPTPVSKFESGFNQGLNQAMWIITHAPTLTPPNEPLTLEQLREMKDEPAYLNVFDPLLKSGWHIIKAVTEDKIIFRGWNTVYVPISSMGKCFDLYAYPPAHIDREAWNACGKCAPNCSWCKNNNESSRTTPKVCRECKRHSNYEPEYKFCCECGRPLTEEAWAELEKRLRGMRT